MTSVVIFQALETFAASLTLAAPVTSLASTASTALFPQKHPDPDGLIITGTKMTSVGHFFWNGSSKIQFFTDNYMVPFLMEAVEAILCYFFENWLLKLKFPNLRNTQIPSY